MKLVGYVCKEGYTSSVRPLYIITQLHSASNKSSVGNSMT